MLKKLVRLATLVQAARRGHHMPYGKPWKAKKKAWKAHRRHHAGYGYGHAHLQQLAGAFSGAAIDFLSFFRHQFAAEPEL